LPTSTGNVAPLDTTSVDTKDTDSANAEMPATAVDIDTDDRMLASLEGDHTYNEGSDLTGALILNTATYIAGRVARKANTILKCQICKGARTTNIPHSDLT